MRTETFKTEMETADRVIQLQMSSVRFQVTGRLSIVILDDMPSELPTSFLKLLMLSLAPRKIKLVGVEKFCDRYNLFIERNGRKEKLQMKKSFCVNDVIAAL